MLTSHGPRPVRAPRGANRRCQGWEQEAALRMLMSNLDAEVAEHPDELVVYGGTGRAVRSWDAFDAIVRTLETLGDDETLLLQSGKPVAVFRAHLDVPRVFIANANLVGRWATWSEFRRLEQLGLTMYGQMTAGSWISIGSQGIAQGTYETFGAVATRHLRDTLGGRLRVTAGLAGMGDAQPPAAVMNGAAVLAVEVDPSCIAKRIATRFDDRQTASLDEALRWFDEARMAKRGVSVALCGNAADVLPERVRRGITPDIVTDQTSAHHVLVGDVPNGLSLAEAPTLRRAGPNRFVALATASVVDHVRATRTMQDRGAVAFDYGNNIRTVAFDAGLDDAFRIPGFVPEYVRPLFCACKGPFRWVALSGEADDIARTDALVLALFPHDVQLHRWMALAQVRIAFQCLPARICWLGQGERARFGFALNDLVARGEVSAPIVIGRDYLDTGSVASPCRETEAMKDGSDAIADWAILNALLNTTSGASWVSFLHGGEVGIGNSLLAGQVIVADGNNRMRRRLERVLTNDPGLGVARHADAGYDLAIDTAERTGLRLPMRER